MSTPTTALEQYLEAVKARENETYAGVLQLHSQHERDVPRVVVRLKTSNFTTCKGLAIRRDIIYLQRQCHGFNFFEEDICMIGADDVLPRIVNLDECKDGIYEITICNESKDWETGMLDDWDYKLTPFTPTPHPNQGRVSRNLGALQ